MSSESTEKVDQGIAILTRSPTMYKVFRHLLLVGEPKTIDEVAKELQMTQKAVRMAIYRLHKKGLIKRASRGSYTHALGPLLVAVLDHMFEAERRKG